MFFSLHLEMLHSMPWAGILFIWKMSKLEHGTGEYLPKWVNECTAVKRGRKKTPRYLYLDNSI